MNTAAADLIQAIDIPSQVAALVRWTFLQRGRMLTCEIMVNSPQSFDVCVITHWNVGLSVIETYESPAEAFCRHAELVSGFRDAGWVRVSETPIGMAA